MQGSTDGRTIRWEGHNAERRQELVESSLRAIRRYGAGASMDDFASEANTSRTVFYRHFKDRQGLFRAIVGWVHASILSELAVIDLATVEPRELIRNLADAYLSMVQRDPEVYRFVMARQPNVVDHPLLDITTSFGQELGSAMRIWLTDNGLDPEAANTWGHGIVGFICAVADQWNMTGMHRSRDQIVDYIDLIFTNGITTPPKAAMSRSTS